MAFMSSVAAYLRCSTRKQDLESQRRALQEWADKHGHDLLFFEDDHTSGRRTDRTGIEALLTSAERGEIKLVAVTELSRIGRSVGFIASTVERLSKLGAKLVLINGGTVLDYETLEGRTLVGALGLAADIEWMLISERNTRGRETIKARGVKVGRKPTEVSDVAIQAMREKGLGVRAIARELGVSHPTIVRRIRALAGQSKSGQE